MMTTANRLTQTDAYAGAMAAVCYLTNEELRVLQRRMLATRHGKWSVQGGTEGDAAFLAVLNVLMSRGLPLKELTPA